MSTTQSSSFPALVMTAIVSVIFGAGAGFFVGQRNSPDSSTVEIQSAEGPGSASVTSGGVRGATASGEVAMTGDPTAESFAESGPKEMTALRVQLRQERDEVARLKEQLAEIDALAAAEEAGDAEKRQAFAKEMFDGIVAIESNAANPEDMVKLAGKLDELDEDLVDFFAARYHEALGDERDDRRDTAVMLALISGGEKASGFLDGILNNPEIGVEKRKDVMGDLRSWGSWVSMERIPLTDSLRRTGTRLRESEADWERAGGAGLLSNSSDAESRSILEGMLLNDPSESVKASAARSLALSGDRTTKVFLQNYYDSAMSRGDLEDSRYLRRGLERALEMLADRFPD